MHDFRCVMITRLVLTDEIRNELLVTARRMYRNRRRKERVACEGCEGLVQTDYSESLVGELYGPIFKAVLDTDRGTSKVHFMIPESDLQGDEELNLDPNGWELDITSGTDPVSRALEWEARNQNN